MLKNPYVAAILNFALYGLGYIYLGKKKLFGILLLISDLILAYSIWVHNVISSVYFNFGFAIMGIALAYDGFKEARKINYENKKRKKK